MGFSNLAASTSKWLAVPVFIFDLGKGALAVFAAVWAGLPLPLQAVVGLFAVAGHNWPVFLKFNGGRGILTSVGVAIVLFPKLAVVLVALSFLGIPFHLLSLTSLIATSLFPVLVWFYNVPVINFLTGGSPGDERAVMVVIFCGLWLILVLRRLAAPRSTLASQTSTGELFLNRFLFDRDIRDRSVWIHRGPEMEKPG